MEDLSAYFGAMDPQQRQALMAEQLRARQRNDQQQKLAAAMQGDPRMKMMAMAGMLSGNKGAQAATEFAYDTDSKDRAPKQLGNTGFFNTQDGEFVENPMYVDEKAATRDAQRWQRELQRETTLDTARARAEQAREAAELRADVQREAEAGRNARAGESNMLLRSIAAMRAGTQTDAGRDRIDRTDEAALNQARTAAGKADAAAAAARGDKPLAGPLDKSIREITAQADVMGELLRDSRPEFFSRGVGSAAPIMEAKMLAARQLGDAAPKDMQDLNAFWARFKRSVDMLVRHENFGSALTAMEQKFWREVAVTPGLGPEKGMELLRKLKIDSEKTLQDAAGVARGNRVNPESIESATRGRFPAPPKPAPADPAKFLAPDRAQRLRERGVLPTGGEQTTGSVSPNYAPPPRPAGRSPSINVSPDGWSVTIEGKQ